MKIALATLRVVEPLDSTEPLNTAKYEASSAPVGVSWQLTWDTDLQVVELVRVNRIQPLDGGDVETKELWRGETPMANVRHWVRAKVPPKGAKP